MTPFLEFRNNLLTRGLEYFGLYYGSYKGIVMSNDDPEHRGRLQLQIPEVWGDDNAIEIWVSSKSIFAGNKIGFHFMPLKGDVVRVAFEYGNPKYPLWEYGWWLKDGAIEIAKKDVYVLATPKGLWVIDEVKNTIYFTFKNGKSIEVNTSNINLGTVGGSAQPAVLGDTLKSKLEEYFGHCEDLADQIAQITVGTPMGVSTPPINAGQIEAIKAQMIVTKQSLQQILSQVVNLD